MKRPFGYPPMSVACRSCSKARLFSAASTLKSRMIALRSRHFRKRTPDLRNSARFNTIPALRGIKMNPVLKKNFAVFPVLDWIATLAAHIPDKGEQLLRYYGYYINVSRGKEKSKSPKRKPRFARSTRRRSTGLLVFQPTRCNLPLLARQYLWLP